MPDITNDPHRLLVELYETRAALGQAHATIGTLLINHANYRVDVAAAVDAGNAMASELPRRGMARNNNTLSAWREASTKVVDPDTKGETP